MTESGRFELVPVDEIELDRANPRIARILEMYEGEPSPEQINLALGAGTEDENASGPTFEKLKQSIITAGRIIQPVILNRRPNGTIVCIEGNTRVSLYKSFVEQKLDGNWNEIPALVHSNIDAGEMDAIRLQAHLVGPRQWDPYSKAKYLHELRTKKHLPWSTIVDYCGGRPRELAQSIVAFEEMEQYYRPILPDESSFDPTRFSGFVELQAAGIKESIIAQGMSITDFSEWIRDGKLMPLQTIRSLPRILRNPEARKVFLKDGARKASTLLEKPDLSKSLQEADLPQLARAIVDKIMKMPWSDMQRLKSAAESEDLQSLSEAVTTMTQFLAEVES